MSKRTFTDRESFESSESNHDSDQVISNAEDLFKEGATLAKRTNKKLAKNTAKDPKG